MKTQGLLALVTSLFFTFSTFAQTPTEADEEQAYTEWATALWDSIDRKTGTIQLPGNVASLQVPDSFYYINKADTTKVLTEIWGNPPESAQDTLGMLFPANSTPFDLEAWGVTIEYEQDGYVNDEDADDINYPKLLEQMQKETKEGSEYRVEQGYEPIALVGWASPPYYDKSANKLHWAKEIKFGQNETNTLNYNIRVLGRKGVLVLNFIAGMDQLDEINNELDNVLAMAEFNEGSRYGDFDPDIDKVAAYGIGALIAGKVVAKTGLLAAAFIFLKKFGVIFVIAIGAFLKKVFSRKKE